MFVLNNRVYGIMLDVDTDAFLYFQMTPSAVQVSSTITVYAI